MVGRPGIATHPLLLGRSLTYDRRRFHLVLLLFQLLGYRIRRTSPTSRVTRKCGLSILPLEIFHRPSATAQDRWLFCFLPYCLFHPNFQSPPKPINTSGKSTLTPYKMYSNSSLHPYMAWHIPASPLTVLTARFNSASQSSLRGLRIIWKMWHYMC